MGQDAILKAGTERPAASFFKTSVSVAAAIAAYNAQRALLVRHFDEGGVLSLNWKKGTDSLGEPLKIQTWRQFYRAAGPPVFARVAALCASFYVAGAAVVLAHGNASEKKKKK
eukprot:1957444-Prymnesium_polylepis.1